jgi:hypothetical protein
MSRGSTRPLQCFTTGGVYESDPILYTYIYIYICIYPRISVRNVYFPQHQFCQARTHIQSGQHEFHFWNCWSNLGRLCHYCKSNQSATVAAGSPELLPTSGLMRCRRQEAWFNMHKQQQNNCFAKLLWFNTDQSLRRSFQWEMCLTNIYIPCTLHPVILPEGGRGGAPYMHKLDVSSLYPITTGAVSPPRLHPWSIGFENISFAIARDKFS